MSSPSTSTDRAPTSGGERSSDRPAPFPMLAWLWLAAFSFGAHGWLPEAAASAAALAAACWLVVRTGARSSRLAVVLPGASTLLVGLFFTAGSQREMVPLAAGLGCLLATRLRGRGLEPAAAWLVCALPALAVATSVGLGQSVLEGVARSLSWGAAWFLPGTVALGPTYTASPLLLLLVLLALTSGERRAWRVRGVGIVALAGVALAVAVELAARAAPAFGSDPAALAGRTLGASLPWIATLSAVTVGWHVFRGRSFEGSWARRLAGWSALAAAAGIASDPATWRSAPEPRVWALYERGFLSWGRPSDEIFGEYSAGMMGTLPELLVGMGAQARFTTSLEPAELEGCDGLVMINLDHASSSEDLRGVASILERGGTVLVIGDHTFLKQDEHGGGAPRLHLNGPLAGSGIRFANDSADPLTPAWEGSTASPSALGPPSVPPGNPSGLLVGGALHVSWPATRLLVGRHGFVDAGSDAEQANMRGWLGDLTWNPGERLGDVCLVAERRMGRGRLLVVGDTTGATNLGRALRWEWWGRLIGGRDAEAPALRLVALAAFAGFGLLALLAGVFPSLLPVLLLSTLACGALWLRRAPSPLARFGAPLAVFDTSVAPAGRGPSWEEDGALSVLVNAMREGYYGIFAPASRADVRNAADLLFLANPQRPVSRPYAQDLLERVAEGVTLFVGCGARDADKLAELLSATGARIGRTALGPMRVTSPLAEQPLHFVEPWPLIQDDPAWRTIVAVAGGTLIAERRHGKGRIVLVSDGRFLGNRGLESRHDVQHGNVELLRGLIRVRATPEGLQ